MKIYKPILNRSYIISIILLIIIVTSSSCSKMLLYCDSTNIRRHFFTLTPISSKKSFVKNFFRTNNYRIRYDIKKSYSDRQKPYKIIGNSYYLVDIGDYGLIFTTSVVAVWIFNEKEELIEIKVWKEIDSI